jgi:Secretion system C-terminal sorting domain
LCWWLNWSCEKYSCKVCVGGKTKKVSTCVLDCNGVGGGTAVKDACNICVGGTTGKVACDPSGTPVNDVKEMNVVISPNPFSDVFTIDYEGQLTWEITNLLGEVVLTGATNQVDMSGFANGSYILKLNTGLLAHIVKK